MVGAEERCDSAKESTLSRRELSMLSRRDIMRILCASGGTGVRSVCPANGSTPGEAESVEPELPRLSSAKEAELERGGGRPHPPLAGGGGMFIGARRHAAPREREVTEMRESLTLD